MPARTGPLAMVGGIPYRFDNKGGDGDMRKTLGVLAMAWTVAGCATPPSAATTAGTIAGPAPMADVAFHCPKPGTSANFNDSDRPVVFTGADAADPFLCTATGPNGTKMRRYANVASAVRGQETEFREGLAKLFPLRAGKTIEFTYYNGYTNDPTRQDRQNESWTVGQATTLQIGTRIMTVIPVKRTIETIASTNSNAWRWTLYYEPISGVWVRGEPELLRGMVNGLTPYTATALSAS
jgi:hypothetical protein